MYKATNIKIKLVSSADTGFYYVTRKNSRTMITSSSEIRPVAKKHVEFAIRSSRPSLIYRA
jgi:large subunit ribosomal protein L33